MKEEFNLSEKVFVCDKSFIFDDMRKGVILKEDVKEFIKLLKESFIDTDEHNYFGYTKTRILEKINKLAGDKLI